MALLIHIGIGIDGQPTHLTVEEHLKPKGPDGPVLGQILLIALPLALLQPLLVSQKIGKTGALDLGHQRGGKLILLDIVGKLEESVLAIGLPEPVGGHLGKLAETLLRTPQGPRLLVDQGFQARTVIDVEDGLIHQGTITFQQGLGLQIQTMASRMHAEQQHPPLYQIQCPQQRTTGHETHLGITERKLLRQLGGIQRHRLTGQHPLEQRAALPQLLL